MSLYLDTSLLVAALTREAKTERVQAWLGEQPVEDLAIGPWVATELSSALSMKIRTGELAVVHRAAALAAFARLAAESLTLLPVSGPQFRTAARFADQYVLGLRAGDALHLAVCADHGATMCTLDRRLAEAAGTLGVPALLL